MITIQIFYPFTNTNIENNFLLKKLIEAFTEQKLEVFERFVLLPLYVRYF